MATIRGVITGCRYKSEDGYYITTMEQENGEDTSVLGYFTCDPTGLTVDAEGQWKDHPRYGRQFLMDCYKEVLPETSVGIVQYLSSGLIKGVGEEHAARIVKAFGDKTFDILENDPNRLMEVKGIGRKRVNQIKETYARNKYLKNLMMFLSEYGTTAAFAKKLYEMYGEKAIDKIKENPYRLCDDIDGVGFLKADQIALSIGIPRDSIFRCKSGMHYTLEKQAATNGHTYLTEEQLIKEAQNILEVPIALLHDILNSSVLSGYPDIVFEDGKVFLKNYYDAETYIAKKLSELSNVKRNKKKVNIASIEKRTKCHYDEIQSNSIRIAGEEQVLVLTGGPGTGKTTTIKGIIAALDARNKNILLAAPTGRAAKRMAEATGREALTIHRLLGYNPKGGFMHNESDPLTGDLLIVDESSMIDVLLMKALCRAIPNGMKLILVGDVDQLPSVGAGNVLKDIIDSGTIKTIRLNRIHRQAEGSSIIVNAHEVNEGHMPSVNNHMAGNDFYFVQLDAPKRRATEEEGREYVTQRVAQTLGNLGNRLNLKTEDIQVLCPGRKGELGRDKLNNSIQAAINGHGRKVYTRIINNVKCIFRVGDRVMQTVNNYDKDVFNGDIGYIVGVSEKGTNIYITFDGIQKIYTRAEMDQIELAYACTIHKAQGSGATRFLLKR